jgi:hypothetical protein
MFGAGVAAGDEALLSAIPLSVDVRILLRWRFWRTCFCGPGSFFLTCSFVINVLASPKNQRPPH